MHDTYIIDYEEFFSSLSILSTRLWHIYRNKSSAFGLLLVASGMDKGNLGVVMVKKYIYDVAAEINTYSSIINTFTFIYILI